MSQGLLPEGGFQDAATSSCLCSVLVAVRSSGAQGRPYAPQEQDWTCIQVLCTRGSLAVASDVKLSPVMRQDRVLTGQINLTEQGLNLNISPRSSVWASV